MMISTSITQKGQVTIPVHIRRKLGLKTGQKVAFEEKGDVIVMKSMPDFFSLRGSLKTIKKYDKKKVRKVVGEYLARRYGEKSS